MKSIFILILRIYAINGETATQTVSPVPLNPYGLSYMTPVNDLSIRVYDPDDPTHVQTPSVTAQVFRLKAEVI
jgi:hypothetical protein